MMSMIGEIARSFNYRRLEKLIENESSVEPISDKIKTLFSILRGRIRRAIKRLPENHWMDFYRLVRKFLPAYSRFYYSRFYDSMFYDFKI